MSKIIFDFSIYLNMLFTSKKIIWTSVVVSVTREKSPNVRKSCPKIISLEKLKILAPTQKIPKTVGDLG